LVIGASALIMSFAMHSIGGPIRQRLPLYSAFFFVPALQGVSAHPAS
jgi:hypothetical protein